MMNCKCKLWHRLDRIFFFLRIWHLNVRATSLCVNTGVNRKVNTWEIWNTYNLLSRLSLTDKRLEIVTLEEEKRIKTIPRDKWGLSPEKTIWQLANFSKKEKNLSCIFMTWSYTKHSSLCLWVSKAIYVSRFWIVLKLWVQENDELSECFLLYIE